MVIRDSYISPTQSGPFSSSTSVRDDSVSPGIVAICGLNVILTLVFLLGRLYSNLAITRRLHLDDYASVVAGALSFTYTGILFAILNRSQSYLGSRWNDGFYLKATFAANTISGPATFFAKSSVLVLYYRIFRPHHWMRYCVFLGLVVTFCLYWITVPLFSSFCASHNGVWDSSVTSQCGRISIFGLVYGSADIAVGLYIMLLPIPAVLQLQLSLKKKLGVIFIFMHGVFALVGSAAGLYYRVQLSRGGNALFYQTVVMICVTVENDMTIVTSSMHPCATYLKKVKGSSVFFDSLRSKLFRSSASKTESKASNTQVRGSYQLQNRDFAKPLSDNTEQANHLDRAISWKQNRRDRSMAFETPMVREYELLQD